MPDQVRHDIRLRLIELFYMDRQGIKQFGRNVHTAWKWFICGLRWLSIVVFGLLFFVGIYFKLPWKMLACIAIIPVVGLFVPKKIQPWVWASLTILILSLWGWVHLPESESRHWRQYEYTEALHSIEEDYLPAGMDNAAAVYTAVLDTYGETIFYYTFNDPRDEQATLNGPWDPNTYPFLDFWLSQFEPGIEQLTEAGRIEQCRFAIPHTLASLKPQMQRINQLKGWTRLLLRHANRDLFEGRREEALGTLLTIVRLAGHLYQQQTLFDQAGAFHVELLAARGLESFIINDFDDPESLERIEQVFLELDPQWGGNWPDILAREKLMAKNLAGLMYEVNEKGHVRIAHNAMMALQEGLGYSPQRLFLNQHEMNRLAVIGLWLALPSQPSRLAAIVDDRFDDYSLRVQKGEPLPSYSLKYIWIKGLNAQSVIDWLAMQQVGYYWALDGQFKRHEALVRQIQIFAALKKYVLRQGDWPEQLTDLDLPDSAEALTDPLCGRPFVYERTGQGFRLYSLGSNGTDDGGLNDPRQQQDDILLWPRTGWEENGPFEPIVRPAPSE